MSVRTIHIATRVETQCTEVSDGNTGYNAPQQKIDCERKERTHGAHNQTHARTHTTRHNPQQGLRTNFASPSRGAKHILRRDADAVLVDDVLAGDKVAVLFTREGKLARSLHNKLTAAQKEGRKEGGGGGWR